MRDMHKIFNCFLITILLLGCTNSNSSKEIKEVDILNKIEKLITLTLKFSGELSIEPRIIDLDSIYSSKCQELNFGYLELASLVGNVKKCTVNIPVRYNYLDSNYLKKPLNLPQLRNIDRLTFYVNEIDGIKYSNALVYKKDMSLVNMNKIVGEYYVLNSQLKNYTINTKEMGVDIFYSKKSDYKRLSSLINECVQSYSDCVYNYLLTNFSTQHLKSGDIVKEEVLKRFQFNIHIQVTESHHIIYPDF